MYMYLNSNLKCPTLCGEIMALLLYSEVLIEINQTMQYFPKGSKFVSESRSCMDSNIVKNSYWTLKNMD